MPSIEFEMTTEPVGFIVYTIVDGTKVSLGAFCKAYDLEILEIANIMKVEGGFKAEPTDAMAFFLFEDRANAFIESLKSEIEKSSKV